MRFAIALVLLAAASQANATTYFLEKQWQSNGNNMCQYSDGSVMNMGLQQCPMSVQR